MISENYVDDARLRDSRNITFQEELKEVLINCSVWKLSLQISKGPFEKIMLYRPFIRQRLRSEKPWLQVAASFCWFDRAS